MATHSSILTWEIPWTEEPGKSQSTGLQRVGHDLATEQHKDKALPFQLVQKVILRKNDVKVMPLEKG